MRWVRQVDRRFWIALLGVVFCCVFAAAQQPKLDPNRKPPEPGTNAPPPVVPTVTFTWDQPMPPGAPTHHYSVAIQSTGRAAYESIGPILPDATPGDPYMEKFVVSPATVEKVFALAKQVDYFHGDFDFKKHRIANTGAKVLAYADPHQQSSTTYNWSENPVIQQLTSQFTGIVITQESARRLTYYRRYDKLGIEPELNWLNDQAKSGQALELQSIAPLLQEIANDTSVLHIARLQAEHLLKIAGPSAVVQALPAQ